jgi:hypothetical protein
MARNFRSIFREHLFRCQRKKALLVPMLLTRFWTSKSLFLCVRLTFILGTVDVQDSQTAVAVKATNDEKLSASFHALNCSAARDADSFVSAAPAWSPPRSVGYLASPTAYVRRHTLSFQTPQFQFTTARNAEVKLFRVCSALPPPRRQPRPMQSFLESYFDRRQIVQVDRLRSI